MQPACHFQETVSNHNPTIVWPLTWDTSEFAEADAEGVKRVQPWSVDDINRVIHLFIQMHPRHLKMPCG